MPVVQPFRGVRYNLAQVGSLSDVVVPPYDVISPEFQDALYKKHPCNYIRVELNRDEPGDDASSKYARAAKFLKTWRQEGVLQSEPDPSLYVYHQSFEYNGTSFTRRGFLCRVRLEQLGKGKIYPHEETHASAKQDRLLLTRACRANPSPIFGLYPDPQNEVQETLESAVRGQPAIEAVDHLGVKHLLWPVSDVNVNGKVMQLMSGKPMFIADGHHRYETACNYQAELASAAGGPLPDDHPANFVLTTCVSMNDPGMIVLPTHRLLRGLPDMSTKELAEKLQPAFETVVVATGAKAAHQVWTKIESGESQGSLGFYCRADDKWLLATITQEGAARMDELADEHSPEWRALGVSILHRLVLNDLLAAIDMPKPTYVHLVDEVVSGLTEAGGKSSYPLAALVMPATVADVRDISEHGERMPAKSTYFYPKLLSGLVIYAHE